MRECMRERACEVGSCAREVVLSLMLANGHRSREGGFGRRGGTEALRAILCKHVAVPGDFASVEEAIARGGAENHLTLYITLGEGTHVLSDTIRPPRGCRIVIRSALLGTGTGSAARGSGSGGISGGKSKIAASLANSLAARGIKVEAANAKGEATQVGAVSSVGGGMDAIGIEEKVRLVVYGGACLVSVQDQEFLANPFCVGSHPAMAQAHITLEGITLEAHVLDRDKFVRDYTDQLYQEFKMKETRGLYRRMLIEKGYVHPCNHCWCIGVLVDLQCVPVSHGCMCMYSCACKHTVKDFQDSGGGRRALRHPGSSEGHAGESRLGSRSPPSEP